MFVVLSCLVVYGKQLFFIINSFFSFVDKGMWYMVGFDWCQFFDVVIVQVDKFSFFIDWCKFFRKFDEKGLFQWDWIICLEKGKIYWQGNLFDFLCLMEWCGFCVFYFGDYFYSDLVDFMLWYGWCMGVIIFELECEICIINIEQYMYLLIWQ